MPTSHNRCRKQRVLRIINGDIINRSRIDRLRRKCVAAMGNEQVYRTESINNNSSMAFLFYFLYLLPLSTGFAISPEIYNL